MEEGLPEGDESPPLAAERWTCREVGREERLVAAEVSTEIEWGAAGPRSVAGVAEAGLAVLDPRISLRLMLSFLIPERLLRIVDDLRASCCCCVALLLVLAFP